LVVAFSRSASLGRGEVISITRFDWLCVKVSLSIHFPFEIQFKLNRSLDHVISPRERVLVALVRVCLFILNTAIENNAKLMVFV
jgi:hypothetical protein